MVLDPVDCPGEEIPAQVNRGEELPAHLIQPSLPHGDPDGVEHTSQNRIGAQASPWRQLAPPEPSIAPTSKPFEIVPARLRAKELIDLSQNAYHHLALTEKLARHARFFDDPPADRPTIWT